MTSQPDVIILMTDEERAIPPYESPEVLAWRDRTLPGRKWFDDHGVTFTRHYTGSLACAPSRPTIFTGHYPDLHGVTQTDGLGKMPDDSRMRWLRPGEVPTMGNWFRAAGYDTHYDGKWHISHADLHDADGNVLATNDAKGAVDHDAVQRYLDADPLEPFGFSGWVGPEPHGALPGNAGVRRDPLVADRVVTWLIDRYARRRAGEPDAQRPFLLVASFVNPHDIVLFPGWLRRSPIKPSPLDPPHVPAAPTAEEDLASKPAAQIAFREAYATGYGPAPVIERAYRGQCAALPRSVLPAARRGRRPDRPGAPRGHRRRFGRRGAGAHLRSRRIAWRTRWFAPEVVQPLRRGDPGAVRDRPHRLRRHVAADGVGTDVACRSAADAAGRGRCGCRSGGQRPGRVVLRSASAAGPELDAGGRRRAGRRGSCRLHHDPRQHTRGRHRRLGGGPPAAADGETACTDSYPGARVCRVELRGPGGPRRRIGCGSWCAPSTIRRPGPSRGFATSRRTGWAARRIG